MKTRVIETTEKYNDEGKLIERITREETVDEDIQSVPCSPAPYVPFVPDYYGSEFPALGKPCDIFCGEAPEAHFKTSTRGSIL